MMSIGDGEEQLDEEAWSNPELTLNVKDIQR